jgi:hypothetical protein
MATRRLFDGAQIEIGSVPIVSVAAPPSVQAWIKVAGTWREATPFVRVAGTWQQATPSMKIAGTWQ